MYTYTHKHINVTMIKEAKNLEKSKEGYMGMFWRKEWEGRNNLIL